MSTTTTNTTTGSTRAKVLCLLAHKGSTYEALEGVSLTYAFPDNLIEGLATEQCLDTIFRQCNHVDGTEWAAHCGLKLRSLSCGDVVCVDGRYFICESFGWYEVPQEVALWVVENITFRDFFGSLKRTVEFFKKNPEIVIPDFVDAYLNNAPILA